MPEMPPPVPQPPRGPLAAHNRVAELLKIFTDVERGGIEAGAVTFEDAVEAALPAVLTHLATRIAGHRCGYQLCSECSCRADMIKLIRGES